MAHAVEKYLRRLAEPEAKLAAHLPGTYDGVLVVPALREGLDFMDGYCAARAGSGGHVLTVVVVNAAEGAPEEDLAANAVTLGALRERLSKHRELCPGVSWGTADGHTALVIDRSSPGRALPPRQGVGMARKIGCDVGLALFAQGRLSQDWIATTDADATLPHDYFAQLAALEPEAMAATFAFRHVPSDDASVDDATARYETALRYYWAGLEFANSPFAFHSLGSALAVRATAYAMAQGFPRRAAAEDFHLLQKVAKLGSIARLSGSPIELRSRASDRAPLGTGPAVAQMLAGTPLRVTAPRAFELLGECNRWLDEYARRPEPDVLTQGLSRFASSGMKPFLERHAFRAELPAHAREAGTHADLSRRLHTWFDGLRTRQFLRAAGTVGLPDVTLEAALRGASFVPDAVDVSSVLRAREALVPPRVGPTLPRWIRSPPGEGWLLP